MRQHHLAGEKLFVDFSGAGATLLSDGGDGTVAIFLTLNVNSFDFQIRDSLADAGSV